MIRLPNNSHRTTIVGRTGTGKTIAGLWHISNYDLENFPWIVFNFKGDEHIDSIEKARHLDDFDYVPKRKETGIFVLHPLPMDAERPSAKEKSKVENYIWKLWERGNIGIFCDEGYMMNDNKAYITSLTQGRSLRIPIITCAQRPAWITRFAFSEADFIQCFHLNDQDDQKRVTGFTNLEYDDIETLGEHQSRWFDVGKNESYLFNPVPDMDRIREIFDEKLQSKKRFL